jgi:hypothetical protein
LSAIYTTYPELINEVFARVKKAVELHQRRRGSFNSRKKSKELESEHGDKDEN